MSNEPTLSVSPAEIQQMIVELEQYRQRVVNDLLQMAQKIKLSKKAAQEHLASHPELARIDAALERLRTQL